jgi:hypothetical protein
MRGTATIIVNGVEKGEAEFTTVGLENMRRGQPSGELYCKPQWFIKDGGFGLHDAAQLKLASGETVNITVMPSFESPLPFSFADQNIPPALLKV